MSEFPRCNSWPTLRLSRAPALFANKSSGHLAAPPRPGPDDSIYGNTRTMTMTQLDDMMTRYPYLPYTADFYSREDLAGMSWAGRLLVEGWDLDADPHHARLDAA